MEWLVACSEARTGRLMPPAKRGVSRSSEMVKSALLSASLLEHLGFASLTKHRNSGVLQQSNQL
jgi:hypothetical protein